MAFVLKARKYLVVRGFFAVVLPNKKPLTLKRNNKTLKQRDNQSRAVKTKDKHNRVTITRADIQTVGLQQHVVTSMHIQPKPPTQP